MADYPPTPSFGIPWGARDQAAPQYHEHNQDGMRDENMEQNDAAYRHNDTIPSFSSFGVASGIPPLPVYGSYTQPPRHSMPQIGLDPEPLPVLDNGMSTAQIVEEGELSEGEFQDSPPKQTGIYPAMVQNEYSPALPLTDSYGRSLDLHRQRSESYSPPDYNDDYEPAFEPGHTQFRQQEQNHNTGWLTSKSSSQTHSSKNTRSLHDARKEAQAAILNLLPLKVKFQNYVEEGIDPDVLRRQFEAIGLPPSSQSVDAVNFTSKSLSSRVLNSHPADFVGVAQQDGTPGSKSVHVTVEERKDRIARLLAEKTRKLSSITSQADPAYNSLSTENTAANKAHLASQIAAKAEKERMLRTKMEALQKSREQRAQKAATKTKPPQPASPMSITTPNVAIVEIHDTSSVSPQPTYPSPKPSASRPILAQEHNSAKPVAPSIPGLFLSASSNTPQPLLTTDITSTASQPVNHRKRPVASDFDAPSSAVPAYKRPFGQNRNDQPLVIDVSDDESDDAGVDDSEVEHVQSQESRPFGAFQNGSGAAKMTTMKDLPPLSDFPPRKPFTTPASAVSTPPMTQTQGKSFASKPEDLLKKEMEIEGLKRKIAEAVRRKKEKQANSGSQTPARDEAKSSLSKSVTAISLPSTVDTSLQIEQLLDDASRQVNDNQQKLAENQTIEHAKVDELKRAKSEQRRLRRAKIASDLPAVDAEVEKSRKRLADLRAEMDQLEAAVQQGLKQKQILAEEMEKLGQEAEEQLQAQKDKLDDLCREEESSKEVTPYPAAEIVELPVPSSQFVGLPTNQETANNVHSDEDVIVDEDTGSEAAVTTLKSPTSLPSSSKVSDDGSEKENRLEGRTLPAAGITPDQALEEALQDASARSDAVRDSDLEDFYAPDPSELARASSDSSTSYKHTDDTLMVTDADKPVDTADKESDYYEPAEVTPTPMDLSLPSGSPPFSPASPEVATITDEVDLPPVDSTVSAFPSSAPTNTTASDSNLLPQRVEGIEVKTKEADPERFFTPYESPLNHFRAYRFHPGYKDEISGGFKSLTYSNNITADQELCRYELAGGMCNDPSCEYQHFKNMGLADDAILVELGNSAGYSEEEKPRFVAGLRTVLQDLRTRKIKDFQIIAAEIAAYRARFLGDNSRILLLDGTSL